MSNEDRECYLPPELIKLYKTMFIGNAKTWMDENRVIRTIYEYDDNLKEDNNRKDYRND